VYERKIAGIIFKTVFPGRCSLLYQIQGVARGIVFQDHCFEISRVLRPWKPGGLQGVMCLLFLRYGYGAGIQAPMFWRMHQ